MSEAYLPRIYGPAGSPEDQRRLEGLQAVERELLQHYEWAGVEPFNSDSAWVIAVEEIYEGK